MPKGAYPAGSSGSTKPPGTVVFWNCALKTSTLPLWKSVAYSRFAMPFDAIASPLYTAPPAPSSYTIIALAGSTAWDHAIKVPPSPSNMNCAGAETTPLLMAKSIVALNTIPVALAGPLALAGRLTMSCRLPAPSYAVAVCVALFATHIGPPGATASPHGLTRSGSTSVPATDPFETTAVEINVL